MRTFAFKNNNKYWVTRYSFQPNNYSRINRDFFTPNLSTNTNIYVEDGYIFTNPLYSLRLWRHNPDSAKCTYYNQVYPSSISFTFNENASANKIYKNLSIEGSLSNDQITSVQFRANDTKNATQLRPTNIFNFTEKGPSLHANIGRKTQVSRANVKPIGILRGAYQVYYPENQGLMLYTGKLLSDVLTDEDSLATLEAAGQGYLNNPGLYNATLDINNAALSNRIFLHVDFFSNYQASSARTKYTFDPSLALQVGNTFTSVNAPFQSYGFSIDNSPNRVTLRKTTKVWSDDTAYTDTNVEASGPPSTSGGLSLDGLFVAASLTTDSDTSTVPADFAALADFNEDGTVTTEDLLTLLGSFGVDVVDAATSQLDLDNNNVIAVNDLLLFLAVFGEQNPDNIAAYLAGINAAAFNSPITLYAVTPGAIDGEAARGNYADVTVNLNGNFELDIVNLDYEPTTLDHSR